MLSEVADFLSPTVCHTDSINLKAKKAVCDSHHCRMLGEEINASHSIRLLGPQPCCDTNTGVVAGGMNPMTLYAVILTWYIITGWINQ